LALAAARAGGNATDGLVILAEEQTVGRGRQGARWFGSPGESLLVSVVYWSAQQADTPARLMMAASVALAEALERTSGVRVGIKWPNDLEIGRKKICGILIECGGSVKPTRHIPADGPGELVASVIGFGLNVNQANQKTFPPELSERATSLQMAAGATLDRSLLLTEILESLETCIELTGEDFLESLAARYMRHCDMIGRRVTVREGSARFSGTVVSVSPDYALIMRLEDGALRSFKAPTVRIE
jgi:BirA family biotin operon repressor/biotin-[acetyl-CoA-carboxylase] ligase